MTSTHTVQLHPSGEKQGEAALGNVFHVLQSLSNIMDEYPGTFDELVDAIRSDGESYKFSKDASKVLREKSMLEAPDIIDRGVREILEATFVLSGQEFDIRVPVPKDEPRYDEVQGLFKNLFGTPSEAQQ